MQIIGTCVATGALAARVARVVVIAVAAVLVAGSIATSISRPSPQSIVRNNAPADDPEAITTGDGNNTLVTLDESTEEATPAPTAVFRPIVVESLVWNANTGTWAQFDATSATSAGHEAGASVPVLVLITGTLPGTNYRVEIDYADCGDSHTNSFDRLADGPAAGATPWLTPPAPTRPRPDSTIAAPIGHSGGQAVSFLAWGATFSAGSRGSGATAGCNDDAVVILEVVARADGFVLGFAGHLRPENTSASAATGFAPLAVSVEPIP
jgi:hypothetical protein